MASKIYIFESLSSFINYGVENIPMGVEYLIFLSSIEDIKIDNLPFTLKGIFYMSTEDIKYKELDENILDINEYYEEKNKKNFIKCFSKIPFGMSFNCVYQKFRDGKNVFGLKYRKMAKNKYFFNKKDIDNFDIKDIKFINIKDDDSSYIKVLKPDSQYFNFNVVPRKLTK